MFRGTASKGLTITFTPLISMLLLALDGRRNSISLSIGTVTGKSGMRIRRSYVDTISRPRGRACMAILTESGRSTNLYSSTYAPVIPDPRGSESVSSSEAMTSPFVLFMERPISMRRVFTYCPA